MTLGLSSGFELFSGSGRQDESKWPASGWQRDAVHHNHVNGTLGPITSTQHWGLRGRRQPAGKITPSTSKKMTLQACALLWLCRAAVSTTSISPLAARPVWKGGFSPQRRLNRQHARMQRFAGDFTAAACHRNTLTRPDAKELHGAQRSGLSCLVLDRIRRWQEVVKPLKMKNQSLVLNQKTLGSGPPSASST